MKLDFDTDLAQDIFELQERIQEENAKYTSGEIERLFKDCFENLTNSLTINQDVKLTRLGFRMWYINQKSESLSVWKLRKFIPEIHKALTKAGKKEYADVAKNFLTQYTQKTENALDKDVRDIRTPLKRPVQFMYFEEGKIIMEEEKTNSILVEWTGEAHLVTNAAGKIRFEDDHLIQLFDVLPEIKTALEEQLKNARQLNKDKKPVWDRLIEALSPVLAAKQL